MCALDRKWLICVGLAGASCDEGAVRRRLPNPPNLLDQLGAVGFDQRVDRESSNAGVSVPSHKPWFLFYAQPGTSFLRLVGDCSCGGYQLGPFVGLEVDRPDGVDVVEPFTIESGTVSVDQHDPVVDRVTNDCSE